MDFRSWSKANKTKAHCKLCHKTFDLTCGGATALDQKGKKYQPQEKTCKADAIGTFFSPQSSSKSSQSGSANAVCSSSPREVSTSLLSFVVDENTLNTEIMWCLNVVKSHYSLRSCDSFKNLFKCRFPDSAIAEKFSTRKDKARYLIVFFQHSNGNCNV